RAWWADTGEPVRPGEWASARAVRSGQTVRDQLMKIERFDGTFAFVLNSAAPILDANERIAGSAVAIQDITALRNAEEAFRLSEMQLKLFVEYAPAAIAMFDREMRYLNVSRRWREIFNLGERELTGASHYEILPDIPPEWKESHRRALAGEVLAIEADRFRRADGSVLWLHRKLRPWHDAAGAVGGIVIFLEDITERVRAEQALREAHNRAVWLARFPDENPIPVMRASADGVILYCNPASVKNRDWACSVGDPLSGPVRPLVALAMESGEELQREVKMGTGFYAITLVPFTNETYVNIYGHPITKRKLAEEASRKSEERLKRAQEIAHLGSWELDLIDNRLSWSDEAYRIFGLQPHEFAATYEAFLERVHPDDREAVDAAYSASLRENRDSYEIEHRVICKHTGEVRNVHERCHHYRDESGRIIRSVGMVHDITGRKQAEDTLRERTRQLEDANSELESFSYSVSHDLRTPLRAIDGFTRMILKKHADKFDEDATGMFEVIRDNARKMGQLIDDLLAFSRLSRVQLSTVTLDVGGLIGEVWEELRALNPDRRLSLKIAEILPGRGDRGLIKQVLVNLLSNAIKFTGQREEALIEAGCENNSDEIIYYIRDNGAGFDMHYCGKLFGVFQRLHSAGDFEGTGVGLAIAKRIINRHGGKIWAEGKVDKGATFYFTLPIV
ncbi:MAG: PAS domain S-box protein, partial [Deltaproteobacteria bacterium]|nr:PAS domain S-box protein [Deltaproteobacteria bacterium]